MRLKQHRLRGLFALAAATAMTAMAVSLVWGTAVGLADFQNQEKESVCASGGAR